jgi:hypothetical protein
VAQVIGEDDWPVTGVTAQRHLVQLMTRRAAMISRKKPDKKPETKPNFLNRWRRWWAAVAFVDTLYRSRRLNVAAFH